MPLPDRRQTEVPQIDLDTARETLEYIHDDVTRVRGLEHVATAMAEAISQLEIARVRQMLPNIKTLRNIRFKTRCY